MHTSGRFGALLLCQVGSALIATSLCSGCGGKAGSDAGLTTGSTSADGDEKGSGGTSHLGSGGATAGTGGTQATGGSVSGTGGSGAGTGGSVSGTGGSGTGGSGPGTGGSGPVPEECLLPAITGDCRAYFVRYAYDAGTGRCTDFVYGGCGGNKNNFETLEECNLACRGGMPGPEQECQTAADCTLIYRSCCGPCGPATPDEFWAINDAYEDDGPWARMGCGGVLCEACGSEEPTQVGVACENNTCVAFSTQEFAQCTKDDDCHARSGSACCGCTDPWLAFSDMAGLEDLVCAPQMSCRACTPQPGEVESHCDDGICQIVTP